MTAAEIQKHKEIIDKMSRVGMARRFRFDPVGSLYFDSTNPLHKYFAARFKALGGMTPEISKRIGWKP